MYKTILKEYNTKRKKMQLGSRLARDYERLPETLVGLHLLAFTVLMLHRFVLLMAHCP